MKITKPKRQQVRPVEQVSILDKSFRKVARPSRLEVQPTVHPLVVLADLRKGSLVSLDRYLAQEGCLRDREVAVELRKLISGSACRTPYRLLVVNHPDRPKSTGGHPSVPNEATHIQYQSMVESFERNLPLERGKEYLAKERVADEFKCAVSTVTRAIRFVGKSREDAEKQMHREKLARQSAVNLAERRRAAIANVNPAEAIDS